MSHPASIATSLLGLGTSAIKKIADVMLGQLTAWVASGAGSVLRALGSVLTSSTTPDLTFGLAREYSVMLVIGGAVVLPLLVLAVIQAVVRQDLGALVRATLVQLPLAVLLSAGATGLVSLALRASDAMSGALLAAAGHPVDHFVGSLVTDLTLAATASEGPVVGVVLGAFGALLLALFAAGIAFMLWLELVVRSAAIAASTLFLPLALAGLVFPASAHWAKRLAETILALVLSKVVIAGVLALAAGEVTSSASGAAGLVEGVALILLAVLAPFSVLRLVPMVEAGAVAHFDGMSRRALRSGVQAGMFAAGEIAARRDDSGSGPSSDSWGGAVSGGLPGGGTGGSGGGRGGGGRGGGGPLVINDVGGMEEVDVSSPELQAKADGIERQLAGIEGPK